MGSTGEPALGCARFSPEFFLGTGQQHNTVMDPLAGTNSSQPCGGLDRYVIDAMEGIRFNTVW
jgi:hypothetical protein